MPRAFVTAEELSVLRALGSLGRDNPFEPGRVRAERTALGATFVEHGAVWHVEAARAGLNPNVPRLVERAEALARTLRARLVAGARAAPDELAAYRDLVYYVLYERCSDAFFALLAADRPGGRDGEPPPVPVWDDYRRGFAHLLEIPGARIPLEHDPAHVFALGFQIRRAFHHVYRGIQGGSMPAARLRAAVWESIFTRDVARYRRSLHARMADIPTLVVGESGTGKELVARAIGLSRYVPFDAKRKRFAASAATLFQAVNLSAVPSALVESELFGHRRGSFTGAIADRTGRLEECSALGAIFLDEIGELEPALQVKLLRVLQERSFQRVGESEDRPFAGKIVAATNRDLAAEMEAGRFRPDLYWRLCADVVRTPRLADQIADAPDELRNLVLVLCQRLADREDAEALADEVAAWIDAHLGPAYPWPGNVRELEQCVRSILVRGRYEPPSRTGAADPQLADALAAGELTAQELLRAYATRTYHRVGTYEGTARRLGLDRRTVKSHVDPELLARLRSDG